LILRKNRDAGYRMQDAGCRIQDTGCKMLVTGKFLNCNFQK